MKFADRMPGVATAGAGSRFLSTYCPPGSARLHSCLPFFDSRSRSFTTRAGYVSTQLDVSHGKSICRSGRRSTCGRRTSRARSFYYGQGCQRCNNTAYKGRCAIHELFVMNDELRDLISSGTSTVQMRTACWECSPTSCLTMASYAPASRRIFQRDLPYASGARRYRA